MIDKILLDIKEAIKKQDISETKASQLAGVEQRTVNRLLSGKTKKPDFEVIHKLQTALGIVAESEGLYSVSIHQQVSPEENELLRYFRQLCPNQKNSAMQVVKGLLLLAQKSDKNEEKDGDLKESKRA